MTLKLRRLLFLWAGMLTLVLLTIIPLSVEARILGALTVVCMVVLAWIRADRRAARSSESFSLIDTALLPSMAYRHPIVLVCGDCLDSLFGTSPAERLAVRTTPQGCYIRVPALAQLPEITAGIETLRPDWTAQLSVMIIVNPAEYTDDAELAGRLRAFCYQIALLRKRGMALPLLLVSYLQSSQGEGPWFTWEEGHAGPSIRENGTAVGLADWQLQAANKATHASRLRTGIQLNSASAWLGERVLPHFTSRDGLPLACAMTWVPVLPESVPGNLWQQWLRGRTALAVARNPRVKEGVLLPFPDPLLRLLPTHFRNAPVIRAGVIGMWIFALAMAVVLISSAWQNKLLLRQVTDDLRRYSAIPEPERRDQPEFAEREEAVAVLRTNALRLDNYYRQGEPLGLGMGLYHGDHLRAPLQTMIATHRQPPAAPLQASESHPVRLDSLSLFGTGSAQLKPDSTKVLVEALVDIKAQPGWLIVITGHTDATGGTEQNLQLSLARAAAVRDWMQLMGDIPDSCFAVQGLGARQPIASNGSEAGRMANRRVDIRLVPEVGACKPLTAGAGQTPPVATRDIQ